MSRMYKFEVEMELQDDDQTDPEDMVPVIKGLLDADYGAVTNWRDVVADILPEARPKWSVKVVD